MKNININSLENWYQNNFQNQLLGRRIVLKNIEPIILALKDPFKVLNIGLSEEGKNIYKVTVGNGPKKILAWSQMHGNESTGTKAMFDLFRYIEDGLETKDAFVETLLAECTLEFIPMLNPDGATNFTRVNANQVDLNRDAVSLEAKESVILRTVLDDFKPEFCFNLHDQRTIFNVEGFKNPATISFLAPSIDLERTLTDGRKDTMAVIVAMNKTLQDLIPNYVGRYTDEFYPTATGDNFQKLGHNTILIEAGHYHNDYDRDVVRKYNFYAMLSGLEFLTLTNDYSNYKPYFDIPNNGKQNYDLIIRGVKDDTNQSLDIAFQYEYTVENDKLVSKLVEYQRGGLEEFTGYNE
ncbi:M14 family zinc carboxypeptidase [Flavobacteriaceae bacterium]|nr:M14 family zinc carboxypeptidase [Flavobacteriaceae bacterium]